MKTFPLNFNKDSNFDKLRTNNMKRKLRIDIYEHYLKNGDHEFFNLDCYKNLTDDIKDDIKEELIDRGFKVDYCFNKSAMLIYLNDENVKQWIVNDIISDEKI